MTNGGFEAEWDAWHVSHSNDGAATFANTSAAHTGTNALLLSVSDAGAAAVQITSSSFVASRSDTYVLRFWMNSSVLRAGIAINFNGADPVFPAIPFEISTNPAGQYQEYLYAFRASGNMSVGFHFKTPGKYWLDDVEVLDLTNSDGWDIPMTYLWQWGQLDASRTNRIGWGGGDNNKSALLPDGSVAWVFNDSYASTLAGHFYTNLRGGTSLPRNCVVHQVGTNLYWLNRGNATFFVPPNPAHIDWIGDCTVESNRLVVLLNELNNNPLSNACLAVATLTLPELKLAGITELAAPGTDNFGSFVNGDDGYYYIYNGPKVARVPVGELAVDAAWRFWNGNTWVTNHHESVRLPNLVAPWSTIRLGPSNFATVFMRDGIGPIRAQFAPSPMGPWTKPVNVYDTPGQWNEILYAPNICAGTGSNGIYAISYSDDQSPEGLSKWVSDKSYYNPHFMTVNLLQKSPFTVREIHGGSR